MYEFHGWISLDAPREGASPETDIQKIRERFAEIKLVGWFDVQSHSLGHITAVMHGWNRKWKPGLAELLSWFAREFPDSHGRLHILDDDVTCNYVVYRLTKGVVTEHSDEPS